MKRNALCVFVLVAVAVSACAAGAKKGFIEPPEPKWGDAIRLIYRSDLPGAALHAGDPATAVVTIWYPGRYEQRRLATGVAAGRIQAQMTVPEQAGFIDCEFVTKDARGGPAYSMVYTREGKAARGAWHQSMFHPGMQRDYRERVAHELALYLDNWEVYRDKWFSAGAFEAAEREFMIRAD